MLGRVSLHQCFCVWACRPLHGPLHGLGTAGELGSWGAWELPLCGRCMACPGSCGGDIVGEPTQGPTRYALGSGRGEIAGELQGSGLRDNGQGEAAGAAGELAQISLDNVVVIYCFCTTINFLSQNSTKGIDCQSCCE